MTLPMRGLVDIPVDGDGERFELDLDFASTSTNERIAFLSVR